MDKISVIMASYLGEYNGRIPTEKRDKQFIRAVKSFINQTYENKELIIIADGCFRTFELYKEHFSTYENIECVIIPKQSTFSGEVRQEGLKMATGDLICYLDNDDIFGKLHLETIVNNFDKEKYDWVYYDDFLVLNTDFKVQKRHVLPRWASIGTSSIAHKNLKERMLTTLFTTGYGHDFMAVMKLTTLGFKFKKLEKTPQYLVCHYSGVDI